MGGDFVVLKRILRCFEISFGLRINLSKSMLVGIGTSNDEVKLLALKLLCKAGSFPFSYLGLPIGGKVRSKQLWNPVLADFKRKLSMWKRNYLSLGRRITLI